MTGKQGRQYNNEVRRLVDASPDLCQWLARRWLLHVALVLRQSVRLGDHANGEAADHPEPAPVEIEILVDPVAVPGFFGLPNCSVRFQYDADTG